MTDGIHAMTLSMTCPYCDAKLKVAGTGRRKITCPKCKSSINVALDSAEQERKRTGGDDEDSEAESSTGPHQMPPRVGQEADSTPAAKSVRSKIPRAWVELMLYLAGAAVLYLATHAFLAIHWFWAACFALSASGWLVFGLPALFREGQFAQNIVDRWLSKASERDEIVNELNDLVRQDNEGGFSVGQAFLLASAITILFCHLVHWQPESWLGYVGYIGLRIVLVPVAVSMGYVIAFEDRFHFRWDRILTLLRNSGNPVFKAAVREWERQQAAIDKDIDKEKQAAEQGAAEQQQAAQKIICVCSGCATKYVLGVNADVYTPENLSEQLRAGGTRVLGGMPGLPDLVRRGRQTNPASLEAVRQARKRGAHRQWRCEECGTVQTYDW